MLPSSPSPPPPPALPFFSLPPSSAQIPSPVGDLAIRSGLNVTLGPRAVVACMVEYRFDRGGMYHTPFSLELVRPHREAYNDLFTIHAVAMGGDAMQVSACDYKGLR